MFLLYAYPVDPVQWLKIPLSPSSSTPPSLSEASVCISMHLFLNSVLLHESVRMRMEPTWSWSVVKRDGQCISLLRCITNTTPFVAENIIQHLRAPVGQESGYSPAILCSRLHKAVVQVSARLGFFLKFWILFGVSGYWQKSVPCGHRLRSLFSCWLSDRVWSQLPVLTRWPPHPQNWQWRPSLTFDCSHAPNLVPLNIPAPFKDSCG